MLAMWSEDARSLMTLKVKHFHLPRQRFQPAMVQALGGPGPVDVGSLEPNDKPPAWSLKMLQVLDSKLGPWGGLIWREGTQPQRMVFLFVKYHCPSKFYISKWPRSPWKTQWQPKMLWCRSVARWSWQFPIAKIAWGEFLFVIWCLQFYKCLCPVASCCQWKHTAQTVRATRLHAFVHAGMRIPHSPFVMNCSLNHLASRVPMLCLFDLTLASGRLRKFIFGHFWRLTSLRFHWMTNMWFHLASSNVLVRLYVTFYHESMRR